MYRQKMKSSLYIQRMIAASVVTPDLYDAELQDSYGVKTPEELLLAMVDDPGEYNELAAYVQKFQGFNALLKLHILPSVFLAMDEQEKAFVVAAVKVKIKNDKEKEKEAKRKSKKKGR